MSGEEHADLVAADKAHSWHPFTQMSEWCAEEHDPLVLVSGQGAILRDSLGREYLDGNSSIWTNLHGHNHPRLNAALQRQLGKVAHTSFLGFTNPPAARLAQELVALWPAGTLTRVFFSDDGSTAVEVALKMAAQYWQHTGASARRKFVAFSGAYHGDTMGASSLGGIGTFHERFAAWQFPVERASSLEDLQQLSQHEIAAVIIEPLLQGANQMRLWPKGMLRDLRAWCDEHNVLLILDEVMTGFGRTGTMFACEQEGILPDLIAVAKGLTGGYLPLAATFATEEIYRAFLGGPGKTLYYGHSYTGNQLACAVALENLAIFREERVLEVLQVKIALLQRILDEELRPLPWVYEIRQCGFIAGIELRQPSGERFPAELRVGQQVCLAARAHGLLTRPILDTIVLMLPYCVEEGEIWKSVRAIKEAVLNLPGVEGKFPRSVGFQPTQNASSFNFFNPYQEIRSSGWKLPHWQQAGAVYFITFRLADSVPASLSAEWTEQKIQWLKSNPPPHSSEKAEEFHKRFSVQMDCWLDQGFGDCVLEQPPLRKIVADALDFFEGERYALLSYVIMPNHVHVLAVLHPEWSLEKILQSWKGFAARKCNGVLGRTGAFWQKDYFDRLVRDEDHLWRCSNYIRRNPPKARLIDSRFTHWESQFVIRHHPRTEKL